MDTQTRKQESLAGQGETELTPDEPGYVPCVGNERFSQTARGVYAHVTDAKGNAEQVFVCTPLRVAAFTRDASCGEWGKLLEVTDPDGNVHKVAVPMRDLAGDGEAFRAALFSRGLQVAPGLKARNRLDAYVSSARPRARARHVPKVGWHGPLYILPDAVFGDEVEDAPIFQGRIADNIMQCAGTLEDWQSQVARFCVNNPKLMLAVSAAFAAPLLALAGMEGGGFHFWGASSLGKTTLLRAAGSVAGGGGPWGFLRQWRMTDNGLEAVAALHNDNLLCLDEIGQAEPKVIAETAYMLANGQGKGRAARDGGSKAITSWRLLFLSTGELTMRDKIAEGGGRGPGERRAMAGQQVRIVDIPADAGAGRGIFHDLHGFAGGHELSQAIGRGSQRCYGTAQRAFLAELAKDRYKWEKKVQQQVRALADGFRQKDFDGQVLRVVERFALVAAAGEIAQEMGIVPWQHSEPAQAAYCCLHEWLDTRGGTESAEILDALSHIRNFFNLHGSSRFESFHGTGTYDNNIYNRAGWWREHGGTIEYLVFPETYRNELCRGMAPEVISKALIDKGYLIPGGSGKAANVVKVPGYGNRRLYRFVFNDDMPDFREEREVVKM